MEGIGAAASIGQLVQYGGVVTVTLIRLIKDISGGPLIYKNEEGNVRLLLRLIRRVSTETDCHTRDEARDDFLELFTRVNLIAQSILQLLGKTSCFVFRVVSAVTRHSSLAEAFQALCNTRELLHLHITSALSQDVRRYLRVGRRQLGDTMSANTTSQGGGGRGQETPRGQTPGNPDAVSDRPQQPRPRFEVINNNLEYNALVDIGDNSVAESHNPRPGPPRDTGPVIMNGTKVGSFATMNLGDKPRGIFKETLEVHRRIDPAGIPASGPTDQQAHTDSPQEECQYRTTYSQSVTVAHSHNRPQTPTMGSVAAGSHRNVLNPKRICLGNDSGKIDGIVGDDTDDDGTTHRRKGAELYQT